MIRSMQWAVLLAAGMVLTPDARATAQDDLEAVAALDREYQAAVKENDAATMDRIMHDDFLLVLGNGKAFTRDELLESAIAGTYRYERQDEIDGTQTVRVSGDTALVTALLWVKGERNGEAFDRRLWFSDTYVRTAGGWQYLFGQASLPLPPALPSNRGLTRSGRVVEVRSYNLKPGTRDRFQRLFLDEAWPLLQRAQIDVVAYGPSLHDTDSWFLMRSFAGVDERQKSEDAFYGSAAWRDGPREDILDCIESYTTVVIELDDATIEGLRKIVGEDRDEMAAAEE
ncbi:MAG: nuclear transport factor 2 family protein [Woeseia sp.]